MTERYAKNTKVRWNWGNGTGDRKVREVLTEWVSRTIKGSEVTRTPMLTIRPI